MSLIFSVSEENVDFFREMGGVVFVHNLSKSSAHSEVRETAQFTLGMLAEANGVCVYVGSVL